MIKTNIQWLLEIPDDWKIGRFKNVARYSKTVAGEKSSEYQRLALTLNGVIKRDKDDNNGLQPKEFDGYQIVNSGDYIFKMIDLQNVQTSRVGLTPWTGLVSPAYLRFTPTSGASKFYYYYLMSLYYCRVFNHLSDTGVRSSISGNEMGNLAIPIPPLDEQKRIADFLDDKVRKIDALIENENKQIEQLKTSRVSIASSLITGGVHHDGSLTSSEQIYWLKSYPQNWRPYPIKYLAKSIRDKYETGLYDYIALENVESFSGHYVPTDTNSYYSLEGTIKADKNDVIFGKLRPYLAKSLLITKKCCVSSEFAVFRPTELILPEYLQMVFLSKPFVDAVNASTYGTKMPRANISYIENMTLPIPPIDQQKSLIIKNNDVKKTIGLLIDKKEKIIETLADYKKSLIYEYVTGKRRLLS